VLKGTTLCHDFLIFFAVYGQFIIEHQRGMAVTLARWRQIRNCKPENVSQGSPIHMNGTICQLKVLTIWSVPSV